MEEINKEIIIDRNRLDDECAEAPGFFDGYIKRETETEHEFKNYEATQEKEIRKMTPDQITDTYHIQAPRGATEGMVSTLLKSEKRYQDLRLAYMDAQADRRSMEKKIEMLKVMAQLHGQGYFSKIEGNSQAKSLMAESIAKRMASKIDKEFTKPRRK